MSNIRFQGNPSGTGTLTIASPNTNSDFTLNLPTANGTIPLLATVTNNGVMFIDNSGQPTSGSGLVFNSSGNLGLGVTPSAWTGSFKALQIGAQGGLSATSTGTFLSANWYTDGTNRYIGSGNATLYQQLNGQHAFYTAGSGTAGNAISFTQAMTLDASGRLGIGTTSPAAPLHVKVATNANFTAQNTGGVVQLQAINDAASAFTQLDIAGSFITLSPGSVERMRIDTSGNVGIGTSSPTTRLDVNGNIGGGSLNVFGTGVPANGINNVATNALGFFTNSVERARIDSSGNLLVNTTTNTNSSRIVSNGVIESTSGGVRFPDGTTQTTAATSSTPWPGVYSGSVANNAAFPVGTTLLVNFSLNNRNNQTQPVIGTLNNSTAEYYINYLGGFAQQINMAGTWVNRGVIRYSGTEMPSGPPMLVQRIA